MKDYCTCGFQRIDETFFSGGSVYCQACRQPLCCDFTLIDPTMEPHPAEITDKAVFACWAHWNGVAALAVAHAVAAK